MADLTNDQEWDGLLLPSPPSWLPPLTMAALFTAVWFRPSLLGWQEAANLEYVVLSECAIVGGVSYFLLEERDAMAPVIIAGGLLVFALLFWALLGPSAAITLPLYIVLRVASLWNRDEEALHARLALHVSLVLLILSWAIAAYVPLPNFGWGPRATPLAFWWTISTYGRSRIVTNGVPAWGFLYFTFILAATAASACWRSWANRSAY